VAVVIKHDVQLATPIGLGDLLEEPHELLGAMARLPGVGDLAGS
jgi:hypothetical protein